MNANLYSLLALDIARERTQEAERHWLARSIERAGPARPSRIRRLTAQLLAAVSRTAANAVRRLDRRVAEDLRRTLALAD